MSARRTPRRRRSRRARTGRCCRTCRTPGGSTLTYAVEPMSPLSSAPHQAKRRVFCGFSLEICSAISRRTADPLPLSWIPGPRWTESRWAPAMTTLSSLVPGSLASTFTWGRSSGGSTLMNAVDPGWARASPAAKEAPTTGMSTTLSPPRVPTIRSSRWGVSPWLKMRFGAGRLGVERLFGERARSPLDQGDIGRTGEIEAGEVILTRDGAARSVGPRRHQVDVDCDHLALDGAEAGAGEDPALVRRRHGRELLESRRGSPGRTPGRPRGPNRTHVLRQLVVSRLPGLRGRRYALERGVSSAGATHGRNPVRGLRVYTRERRVESRPAGSSS